MKQKEINMDKFKKIGVTALAGTLAAFTSANAIDVSFGGTAKVTWGSTSSDRIGTESATRDAFNADSTISASASGELDNGWTVSGFMDDISNGMTSSAITIGMGSMGSVRVNQAATGAVDGWDDVLPVAYEETNDGAKHATRGIDVGDSIEGGSLSYISPTLELGGATLNIVADFDPAAGAAAADGTGVAGAANTGSGMGYAAKVSAAGFSVYGGYSEVKTELLNLATTSPNDKQSVMGQVTYSMGPVSIGYGEWYTNEKDAATDYSTDAYSIAFAVSDDLSISYGNMEDTREASSDSGAVTTEMTSYQIAYTMGSMALKFAHTDTDNGYHSSAKTAENTEIAVSFSF